MNCIGRSAHQSQINTETFRMIPDRLWTHPDLQLFDLKLWCVLQFLARGRGCCDPTDAVLAAKSGASQQTVRRSLQRLETAEFVTRTMESRTRVITLKPEGDGQPIEEFVLRLVAG
jgi:hypothetical protein